MRTRLLSKRALGEHRCQRLHLFGCLQIGPDAHIDDSISDRINARMVVDNTSQLLDGRNQ